MTITASRATSPFDDPDRMGGTVDPVEEREEPADELDSDENQKILTTIRDWYEVELERQAANRYQMAMDEDYYDSLQWSAEDAETLINRGQAPLVYNEIKITVDWMIGTERRAKIDAKVLPRKGDKESLKDAISKTNLMKYLSDVNKTPHHRSMAFEKCIKAGLGWLESGVRGDPTDELLYTRSEDWRNIIYDSNHTEQDYSDGRYLFRQRKLDEDIAIAYFPERAEIIRKGVTHITNMALDEDEFWYMGARVTEPGSDYQTGAVGKYLPYNGSAFNNSRRAQVKMVECWYKQPVLKRRFIAGEYEGEYFDSSKPEHVDELKNGNASLYDKLGMEVRIAIFCAGGLVYVGTSPYKHNRIPFTPVWCYRRARDNAPYGPIRPLRDAQDDLNKRASKALWILSTNQIEMDDGAHDDVDELREQAADPSAVIVWNKNTQHIINRENKLAEEHLMLMDRDIRHIRNSGVNDDNLGKQTNATSGIAVSARQEQGSVTTTAPFDNLRFAVQCHGEMELSLIEQYYTAEKTVRITGERGGTKFEDLNQPDGNGGYVNDITARQADFIVSEQSYRSSIRQAMFESLFDIIGRLSQMNPQVGLNLLDLAIEMVDELPNRDEMVARIRKLNGQRDADEEISPEDQQAMADQKQQQDIQTQLSLKTMENQLSKLVAETGKLDAQAMGERIKALYGALQAGQIVASVPGAAEVADEIAKGAGFSDATKSAQPAIDAATQVAEQMQPVPPEQSGIPPSPMNGVNMGIQTPGNDGAQAFHPPQQPVV